MTEVEEEKDLIEKLLPWPVVGSTGPHSSKGICRVSGGTDNKGNGHIVAKLMTTSFPLIEANRG